MLKCRVCGAVNSTPNIKITMFVCANCIHIQAYEKQQLREGGIL